MAKEYIERDAVFDHLAFCRMEDPETKVERVTGVVRTKDILAIPAADVIEVFLPEEDVLAEIEDDYKNFQKIRTNFAQIVVENIEKPYYSILWWDEDRKEYNLGYSSYCLAYVAKWRELVFEVIEGSLAADVVEVVHGRWEYLQDDEWRCSNCHTVFNTGGKWIPMTDNFCSECGADMRERRDDSATD